MNVMIEYDPSKFSARTNALILLRAQEWECSPAEAVIRLLNEVAEKHLTEKEAA